MVLMIPRSARCFALLAFSLSSLGMYAQSDALDFVDGRVVAGAAAKPVADARVELVNSCQWMKGPVNVVLKATTDAQGMYHFAEVQPGGCFVVKAYNTKGQVAAQTAEFEMASYAHPEIADLNIEPVDPADPYKWLEDVNGARSMDWVKSQNARTLKALEADPHYQPMFDDALKIAEDPHRLPLPMMVGDWVFNFWRDAAHPHGLLRRTTRSDYATAEPHWQTIIDVDALGVKEGVKWVWHGMQCLYPGNEYCMVELSAGGEDAASLREFNLKTGSWVADGFTLPRSKQSVAWKDKDTLLLSRDWGAGTMTTSGYPFVVKEWKRGTPLDSAKEIYRGQASDMDVSPRTMHDARGHTLVVVERRPSFFEVETWVVTAGGLKRLAIPKKAELSGLLDGRLLVTVREDWSAGGASFSKGSLVEMKIADVLRDPEHLKPAVVFAPTKDEFLGDVATTRGYAVLTTLDHVQGRASIYRPTATGWTKQPLDVPENVTVDLVDTSNTDDAFYLEITGFLTPPTLQLGDAAKGTMMLAKSGPTLFDASKDAVEQRYATSKDGTQVPYFIVHRKDMKLDGTNPTLLDAYGGFEVSETPSYSGNIGKLWLERGGVYVRANIRGGGEFGPAWHEAGLNVHRQRIYDDFYAVAGDLMTTKVTGPAKLGILGGSNGGLLMGVEFEQHPAMWKAVVIQVPLLDMLNFEHIEAGASWVGEYGSVKVPEQRAFLASISPYQNLKADGKYPEPLIFTTTKDDRVGPEHARKFAAEMEGFHLPFYYYEEIEGGHAAGADLKEEARTWAITYTYLAKKLME
ncbi:prolyl oligopeptidase [Bryocella elongata]|uniref:Prolyl oligopeptidase n=1 Tax=Bryocella elongata TaxID=863522 RepID=A0A1H5XTJ0_9BACT|nr:prolyl oligopeptidase family serine peptidase [Bryocella elongata]SEG14845.1 prolyl oligopeptidase [Bryocella elongata]